LSDRTADIKKAIRDLSVLAIAALVEDVHSIATGVVLLSLNGAVANLASYVSVSLLTGVMSTITPIVNVVFIIGGIVVLLEMFGADALLQIS